MNNSLAYRPEIDGLRAVAVVAVIIFHLKPTFLSGGFLGVDVFFVISGFLITSIIQKSLSEKSFSLRQFWMRRVHRIYPALMVMVAVVAILGNFILINPERQALVSQSFGAVASFANILLWKTTSGYWAPSSEDIVLLHTWSLSLEEQFYIVFPLFLLILHTCAKRWIPLAVLLLAVCSLIICVYTTPSDRSAAFYLLHTRMWELLIGSLLAVMPWPAESLAKTRSRSFLALFGIFLVLVSFVCLANDERFPGLYPLLPCIGTAIVLVCGRGGGIAHAFLTLSFIRYLGIISYSLYLWHWPVIAFSRYVSPYENIPVLLLIMLALASISYHYVEVPFRRGFAGSPKLLLAMPVLIALCLSPIQFLPSSPGIPAQISDLESKAARTRAWEYEATELIRAGKLGVVAGNANQPPSIILIGSSHARVLSPPLAAFAKETNQTALIMATSGIGITSISPTGERPDAKLINALRFSQFKSLQPKITIVAGMWTSETSQAYFRKEFRKKLTLISEISDYVIVVSQVPMFLLPEGYTRSLPKYLLAVTRSGLSLNLAPTRDVAKANAVVRAIVDELDLPSVIYINIYNDLMTANGFIKFSHDGQVLYSDSHHVNDRGARYVFEKSIQPRISQFLSAQAMMRSPCLNPPGSPATYPNCW